MGGQYLTMAEIEKRYANEWVLIDRPTTKRRDPAEVTGGYVVMHTPDREELHHKMVEEDAFPHVVDCAILFMGRASGGPHERYEIVDDEPPHDRVGVEGDA